MFGIRTRVVSRTTGSGKSEATIAPMLGTKFNRKASRPNTQANSTPSSDSSPSSRPVTAERNIVLTMQLFTLVSISASTNGTSTGRSRYAAAPKAISVSARRQNVCTRR
jgi:hypothetical protein